MQGSIEMKKQKNNFNKKSISIFEILILVIGIIAISYAVGSESKLISAADEGTNAEDAVNTLEKDSQEINSKLDKLLQEESQPAPPSAPSPPPAAVTAPPITNTPSKQFDWSDAMDKFLGFGSSIFGNQGGASGGGRDCYKVGEKVGEITLNKGMCTYRKVVDKKGIVTQTNPNSKNECAEGKLLEKDGEFCMGKEGAQLGYLLGGAILTLAAQIGIQVARAMVEGREGLFKALMLGPGNMPLIAGALKTAGMNSLGLSWGIAAVGGLAIFLMTYKEEKTIEYSFEANVWEPPLGGDYCRLCNLMQPLPCSEYQCKSLGKSCELENQGTKEELCVWKNQKDVDPPVIRPWDGALPSDNNYRYTPSKAVSPPDTGVDIIYEQSSSQSTEDKGCIKPFTPISFGITTDEPASCKIDYQNPTTNGTTEQEAFDAMGFYFGGSNTMKYNFTQVMSLPNVVDTQEGTLIIENGKEYNLFVRCQDANGNVNTLNFVFHLCVDKGKDTTPPMIVGTDPGNNMPVAHNTSALDVNVYTNEPGKCRWDKYDKVYIQMANEMTGGTEQQEFNAQMLTQHVASLTGIHDSQENTFYFRCSDDEEPANVNTQSYVYKVIGTQPLEIESLAPNGTIKDSTTNVKVTLKAKTLGGYEDGKAICYFKDALDSFLDYAQFFKTDDVTHEQDIWLQAGTYTYSYRCVDLAGNADTKETTFTIKTDTDWPVVVRIYQAENSLKLITDEEAQCVYDTTSCNYQFKDGIEMNTEEKVKHSINWDPDLTFYIKCKDIYENQPDPTKCSVIARPFQIFTEEELIPQ